MLIGTAKLHLPLCEGSDDWDTSRIRIDDKLVASFQRAKNQGCLGVWKECSYSCYRSGRTIRSSVAIWKRHGTVYAIQELASPFPPEQLLDLTQ